ncbi:MAG: bifunctional methylenetetrahydrofolate dehydrogenase/methenyltetrahydrofolate cyclohydrolase FolD [Eubacteriales bacterium]
MAKIIDGKKISSDIRAEIAVKVEKMKEEGITPGLAVIIVGENPASKVYVRNKGKACAEVGMYSEIIEMPEDTSEKDLLSKIAELNGRDDIHGILVQLPLPKQIDERAVIAAISPEKDVDAFCAENVGKIMIGTAELLPCTPAGIMELLSRSGISVSGKECVVVGRSNIVGKPVAQLLLAENGTVTICHSKTKDLAEVTRRADILVVAIGKADFITGDMIKDGAAVIDVGMNRRPDGKLTGDVDFASAEPKAGYITPVPGGVGPMTITMLLQNTLTAAEKSKKK